MKVFSENEWSPLKEVIVGSAFSDYVFDVDLSFKLFFRDNYSWGARKGSPERIVIKKKYVDELQEDVECFSETLTDLGINVHRPNDIKKVVRVKTPHWSTEIIPALNVRDQTVILGDTILETSPCVRNRYFENDLMKDIFYEGFLDGANWMVMPRPIMTDNSFDRNLLDHKSKLNSIPDKPFDHSDLFLNPNDIIPDANDLKIHEMMIDGAQLVRFGKDIIINIANKNHYLGYLWIKRQFPQYNYHPVYSLCDNHLDTLIVPLCEGVLLLRSKKFEEFLPPFLKDWKIIYPPEIRSDMFPKYDSTDLILTSPYIDMNILSVDGNKIIVNELFPELSELLYSEGFDPIPVRHRHRKIFAGGFHCFTLDLLRG